MKIIIENTEFDVDLGCKVAKLKYQDCPFTEVKDIWENIEPLTFREIAQIPNIEQRRIAVKCFGIENLVKSVNPTLLDRQTIKKTTTFVNRSGVLETKEFDDTYELYEVEGKFLNNPTASDLFFRAGALWSSPENYYYVSCKDTSTDRQYLIWVDLQMIAKSFRVKGDWDWNWKNEIKNITATQAIAWTIQTNVAEGDIIKIIRQGDCILVKKKKDAKILDSWRHITEKEYLKLLVAES